MIDWYKKALVENYANFNGRARRSEYWNFTLVNVFVIIALYVIMILGAIADIPVLAGIGGILVMIFALGTFIPHLAVAVRRLHDTGKSGAFLLLGFVPFVSLILLVFYATEGDKNTNQYGEDPKDFSRETLMTAV
ncbi:DUF805 domain-containing protein [Aggregatimonas sangjinii]|uniref:DUF805 domain-containing protein n=2 Tax=Aggregatimonas sangjinii TaxID=2583587 RepID=A0A5B7SYP6_9FLAO|nr:DUF805 domain-containing protein [Aggregatimonas sangjinii]